MKFFQDNVKQEQMQIFTIKELSHFTGKKLWKWMLWRFLEFNHVWYLFISGFSIQISQPCKIFLVLYFEKFARKMLNKKHQIWSSLLWTGFGQLTTPNFVCLGLHSVNEAPNLRKVYISCELHPFRNFFSYKLMLGSCVQQAQNLLLKKLTLSRWLSSLT